MIKSNPASTNKPINELIKNRWSPRSFQKKGVTEEDLETILEAGRWAPSSFNEQPWSYVIGKHNDSAVEPDETFTKLASCLNEGNSWAKEAPVLMLSVAKKNFDHHNKPNRHYMHDTGAASVLMAIQATELDLFIHQMAGFDPQKARELFNIDDNHEPVAMIAIGYPGDLGEPKPRTRKPLDDMIWKS